MADAAPQQSLRSLLPLLRVGCLLTLAGGYLDAYAWVAHNHVFANAQTGNVVLVGIALATGDLPNALHHALPVLAFVLGVAAARLLTVRAEKSPHHTALVCLAVEWCLLLLLHLFGDRLPRPLPDTFFVPFISFSVAMQITSFSALGPLTFNSAMTTGNLKSAVEGWVDWLHHRDREGRLSGVLALCIVASFLTGAWLGAVCAHRLPGRELLPCLGLIGAAEVLLWWESRKTASTGAQVGRLLPPS